VLNLVLLAVLDFLYREMPIYQKASSGHILSAGFSIILIGLVVFSLITNDAATLRLGHVGVYQPGDEVAVDQSVSGAMTMTSIAGAPSMTARIANASATSV
jgi:hypothetical protein